MEQVTGNNRGSRSPQDDHTRRHLRSSLLLLSGRVVSLAINFTAQVVVVRYLSKSDYGALALALSMVAFGTALSVFGLGKTARRLAPLYHEQRAYPKLCGAILLMAATIIILGLLTVVAAVVFAAGFGSQLVSSPAALTLLMLLIVLAPVESLDSLLLSLFAAFARPSAIFVRRYLLGPGLKLAAVVFVVATQGSVVALAVGYTLAGLSGMAFCLVQLCRTFDEQQLWKHFRGRIEFPSRDIFGYSLPQVGSEMAFQLRSLLVVLLLESLVGTAGVAEYRVVCPLARLNEVVIVTFGILFMPTATRMLVNGDQASINRLYWRTAGWITVCSFPLFAACFALAEPLTVAFFGVDYADSAPILALLSVGYYVGAMLGYNAQTLKVFGQVKFVLLSDLFTVATAIVAMLLLIPDFGAAGAAVATCIAMVIRNLVNQTGLFLLTDVRPVHPRCLALYAMVAGGTLALVQVQSAWSPPLAVGLGLTVLATALLVFLNRDWLDLADAIPELGRVPVLGRVLG